MSYQFNCTTCGKTGYGSAGSGPLSGTNLPSGWKSTWGSSKIFCSNRCKDEFNERNDSKSSNRGKGIINSLIEEKPKSDAQIAADEKRRKEVSESDARFFDSIKKIFLFKKSKKAKELHVKLEEIEADIRFSLSKGDVDKAHELIRQLKHDSSLFVPKSNISYNKYWTEKRENILNKL